MHGKQASNPESHRLARLAKQDSLSRCVNPMTRIVLDGLKYSGQQQGQLIEIQERILLMPRHDSPSSVTRAERSDKPLEGYYMLYLEIPNDIQTRLELLYLSTGISTHFFALEAILEYLDDIETRHQERSESNGQSGMGEAAAPA